MSLMSSLSFFTTTFYLFSVYLLCGGIVSSTIDKTTEIDSEVACVGDDSEYCG